MKGKFLFTMAIAGSILFTACGDDKKDSTSTSTTSESTSTPAAADDGLSTDPKGVGPHQNVQLTSPLDEAMVAKGKGISDVKCTSCHKTNEERLVGPGWAGVTDRRTPEWIMNFITNTDEMLKRDTAVQNMLEVCLVKMPNQGLSDDDARSVLEYMRKLDGKK
jgi:cytochrome c5